MLLDLTNLFVCPEKLDWHFEGTLNRISKNSVIFCVLTTALTSYSTSPSYSIDWSTDMEIRDLFLASSFRNLPKSLWRRIWLQSVAIPLSDNSDSWQTLHILEFSRTDLSHVYLFGLVSFINSQSLPSSSVWVPLCTVWKLYLFYPLFSQPEVQKRNHCPADKTLWVLMQMRPFYSRESNKWDTFTVFFKQNTTPLHTVHLNCYSTEKVPFNQTCPFWAVFMRKFCHQLANLTGYLIKLLSSLQ